MLRSCILFAFSLLLVSLVPAKADNWTLAEQRERNRQHHEDMLAHPEVEVLPSGLGFQQITEGNGAKPSELSSVQVYYRGRLLNGDTFDAQLPPDEPIEFILHQVIPGWQEGLKRMREGGSARLHVPPQLAYGAQSMPGIPPFSLLIFDIELVRVIGFRRDEPAQSQDATSPLH
ncbi:FKBP-type peptidyl-prolyl cis-trans isomerase [Alkalimonas sp. MEB108]|uniref:Peptidyl-prolyl cis-trans isomerase n=1 Tax=Alkalimonas cellulosilytica TaxID=3058395 RepID=A0ABU7J8B7_9GAMM|nr:FKBP-type peptidyl-prolyl cis-trans isomerase [Alkalimonas sp. MEB108]MEE2002490.1 FKBP-type peptidyl-prolyl cis-trans isomerase [Alkalimonas sp. MEB108]